MTEQQQQEQKTSFTIEDKEYFIEDLSEENKTKLSLHVAATNMIAELKAKINIAMVAKDQMFTELKDSLENDGNDKNDS